MRLNRLVGGAWLACGLVLALAGCAAGVQQSLERVPAKAETAPVRSADDAADDPAIWVHPNDPSRSLIVGTDKRSGLLLYDLAGRELQYLAAGNLNNVDLRQAPWGQEGLTLLAASQRLPSQLVLFTLDQEAPELKLARRFDLELRDPYGICIYQDSEGTPFVIVNDKDGQFLQYQVSPQLEIRLARRWRLKSQPEGCVADDQAAMLYVGEEGRGIWALPADPAAPAELRLLDSTDGEHLVADVEGLALYAGPTNYLVASSQGNSSFVVYRLPEGEHVQTFRIAGSGSVDEVSGTDGLAVSAAPLPGYPNGLLVVQDDENRQPTANQNFKLVSWAEVVKLSGFRAGDERAAQR